MVSDRKIKKLGEEMIQGKTQKLAALNTDLDPKTARKYIRLGQLPSDIKVEHTWRTRTNPYDSSWEWVAAQLEREPGLEAKTLFDELQRQFPGTYQDGQLRTLQRQVKRWRALEGPAQDISFPQEHTPAALCASDFTHMNELKVTINYEPYDHMVYHFVLTYSNWESFTICSSESFENLSDGLQNALWELQGVPIEHLTDSLSAAVKKLRGGGKEFTDRYQTLLTHYHLSGRHTEPVSPNQNGDVEARNRRLKECVDQALMLRGSRDFPSVDEYEQFLRKLTTRMNAGRQKRLNEELPLLHALPSGRLDSIKCEHPRVGQGSTISIQNNVYSVHSRLIGEIVEARISGKTIAIWYAQKKIDEFPRFRGRGYARIDYRHIIDVLVKKPGAFEHYRYREELFPTHCYRMAYDALAGLSVKKRSREYLRMLQLAAHHGEIKVQQAIISIIESNEILSALNVEMLVCATNACIIPLAPRVACANLKQYEVLYRIQGGLQ